jgi:hypothetical protein
LKLLRDQRMNGWLGKGSGDRTDYSKYLCLSVCTLHVCCLPVWSSGCWVSCLCVRLSIYLPTRLPVYKFMYIYMCTPHLSDWLSFVRLSSVYVCVFLVVYTVCLLSIYLYIYRYLFSQRKKQGTILSHGQGNLWTTD